MNTMADGAAKRLVAQIGEALFGQPGLTLMELAEKVKESRSNASPLGYVRVEAIKALREDDEVTGVMVHVDERTDSVPVYLAARQPVTAAVKDSLTVGISTEWVLGYFDTDLPERARDAVRYAFAEYASLAALEPKPAQAVDLGQFREAVSFWGESNAGWARSSVWGQSHQAACAARAETAKRLLDLIDKAVQS